MISFYPGPSKVYKEIPFYLADAYHSGILSVNHRSAEFMKMCEATLALLHLKLNIPIGYKILFVSSATEVWEIITQSFTDPKKNTEFLHFYNGAFGEKWAEYSSRINKNISGLKFRPEENISIPEIYKTDSEQENIICITQNETSNGTQVSNEEIDFFRNYFKKSLIAVDATSSLGGIKLNFENADIWFASVQKCLGLPAGLGLMIVSPKAIEWAKEVGDMKYYNSFLFMFENIQKFQTHYTPNILCIYLLMRVLDNAENIEEINKKIKKRSVEWKSYFDNHPSLQNLISNPSVRSDTIMAISSSLPDAISTYKKKAQLNGIILGNGYGDWKNSTFRIANFPQIEEDEIAKLKATLSF